MHLEVITRIVRLCLTGRVGDYIRLCLLVDVKYRFVSLKPRDSIEHNYHRRPSRIIIVTPKHPTYNYA